MILDILQELRLNNILIDVRLLAVLALPALSLAPHIGLVVRVFGVVAEVELVRTVYDLHFEFFAMT